MNGIYISFGSGDGAWALVTARRGEPTRLEWPATLDVAALEAAGWRPTPFREFVLKVHSRCDLACDYCYMYTMADQSWRDRPLTMAAGTVDDAARRIAEHARAHALPAVEVCLHGGEPLLAGPGLIEYAATGLRAAVDPATQVNLTIQTNGVRLNQGFLDLLKRLNVTVGVSIDGNRAGHDRHRRFAHGGGSYALVAEATRKLSGSAYRDLFRCLLCTIDVTSDPVTTYDALADFDPPVIDFLLPHGNWTAPPPGRTPDESVTPYADWLITVFDHWYGIPGGAPQVRLFGEIMHALLGGASATEAIGLSPVAVMVIETDGAIEQSDSLKSAYPGAPSTGAHVATDSFDSLLRSPWFAARQLGADGLSDLCQRCRLAPVCGGGDYVHRYRAGHGMLNPSVYCPDLYKLIGHIRDVMAEDITALPPPARPA